MFVSVITWFLLLFFLLMIVYWWLIGFYYNGWTRLPVFTSTGKTPTTFISVIVPVRNEEKNIEGLIASLDQQTYPKELFQIVIVDDYSDDKTWELLQKISLTELFITGLRMADQPATSNTPAHHKRAIETGISIAAGKLIVTTDADCRFHKDWLTTIAAFYEEKQAKFIAAPVKMMLKKKSLLGIFQSLDFMTLQGITAASVHRKFHSMCNGANLAYEKEAFYAVNGFENVDHIASGDDMLLMHKIFTKYPGKVFYLKSKPAIVETEPALSWSAFFQQRIRWASKADKYDDKRIFWVLLLVYSINLSFLALAIVSFWKNIWLFFFCLLLIAKVLIEFPFVNTVAIFFGQQALLIWFPFLQPLHILYTIIAGWLGKFGHYNWKGRSH
jgi:cellulose synthase/poly-beta-1,6-N-acetylglucosamine synthase-like glycosyltransferase